MRVLMLSDKGAGLGLAHKVVKEGHNVKVFIRDANMRKSGMGIVDRVSTWRPHLVKTDLVICDSAGFGKYADTFRRMGLPAFGCSLLSDALEADYGKQLDILRESGIGTSDIIEYGSPTAAMALVDQWPDSGVTFWRAGSDLSSETITCRDPDVFKWELSKLEDSENIFARPCIEGVEVSTEGLFNGSVWLKPFFHTFCERSLLPSGGPTTDCMGSVVVAQQENRLVEDTLIKVTPLLMKIGYRGPISIRSIVNGDGVFSIGIEAQLRFDAIEAIIEGLKEPVTDLMFETAVGIKRDVRIFPDYMLAVRLSMAPWPLGLPNDSDAGKPIPIPDKRSLEHALLLDVISDEDGYKYAASSGVLAKVTARGSTVKEAGKRVYRTIKNLNIVGAQFRSDIGDRASDDINNLKALGYIHV